MSPFDNRNFNTPHTNHRNIMIYTIGITGGIGSGKSFICHQLEEAGFKVFYCDDEAKRIMRTHATLKRILSLVVGDNLYDKNGEMNKEVMSAFLRSGKKEEVNMVNGLIHPLVALSWFDTMREWEKKTCHSKVSPTRLFRLNKQEEIELEDLLSLSPTHTLFMECALLFESDFSNLVDHSVLVHVSPQTQLKRLMARNHISEAQAKEWIGLQMSEKKKMELADFILDNNQDRSE